MFTHRSLSELEEFIKVVGVGMTNEVKEGDYDGLVEVHMNVADVF